MSAEVRLPPGPRAPAIVQTAVWFRSAQWLLSECARRFGDTFSIRIVHEGTWVVLSDPELVKQVFTGSPQVFHAGEGNRILLPVLGARSLLLLDEKPHLEQRKLLLPPFHGERMQAYGELMGEIAREEISRWPRGQTYALRPRMQAITLEIILRTVFGVERGDRLDQLRDELRSLLDLITNPRMLVFPMLMGPDRLSRWGPFRKLVDRVDAVIYREIERRRGAPDLERRQDVMSLLLQARHEDGSPMSDEELRDELVTLLVAGHETTATALAWAVERLAHHPEKLERLTQEVRGGGSDYLDAVVIETLRLRPVISVVSRRVTEPVQLGPWQLPRGSYVMPSIYLMHRRPEIYPDPERFQPERFLERPPATYTWIPFGGGVRRCIGAAFAQFEMAVVLRELVARWQPRPARAEAEPVLRRAITETPRYDGEVVLT